MITLRDEGPSYDQLVRLLEVFSGDKDLMSWFLSLECMADNVRTSHLQSMVQGMKNTRTRPDLIEAVEILQSPAIFKAAVRTIQDLNR
jgi:hypothetical protein